MSQSLAQVRADRRGARFEWSDMSRRALELLANGGMVYQAVADELGISRVQLWELRRTEPFAAALDELRAMLEEETKAYAVANRHALLEGLTERRERLLRIVTEREEHHEANRTAQPGATSGYLVKTVKNIGSGPSAYPVDEWAVDKALVSALNDTEKFGAQLAGVLVEKRETDMVLGVQGPPRVVRIRDQRPSPYSPNNEGLVEPGRYEEAEDGVWRDTESGEPYRPEESALEAGAGPDVEAEVERLIDHHAAGFLTDDALREGVRKARGY